MFAWSERSNLTTPFIHESANFCFNHILMKSVHMFKQKVILSYCSCMLQFFLVSIHGSKDLFSILEHCPRYSLFGHICRIDISHFHCLLPTWSKTLLPLNGFVPPYYYILANWDFNITMFVHIIMQKRISLIFKGGFWVRKCLWSAKQFVLWCD